MSEETLNPSPEKSTPVYDDAYLQKLSDLSLNEILQFFQSVIERGDQQEMFKVADFVKSSFYKALKRDKVASGYVAAPESGNIEGEASENAEGTVVSTDPFVEVERAFKDLHAKYRDLRNAYLAEQETVKEANLQVKLGIIEELKALIETQEDVNKTFPAFRDIQRRWRESGLVPQTRIREVTDTYNRLVEQFYDYVKLSNEFRDLDFKKNLEVKESLCAKAEALLEEPSVVAAFNQLQKLHEEWKELGPVDKEHRESIWERFKAATAAINKKHQAHFESLKSSQKENLAAKTALCEKAEEIAARDPKDSNEWNTASKELEGLQKEWRGIGFASKKDNQKIYDRFRAACDTFFDHKRVFYNDFKDNLSKNLDAKTALCEQAEALQDSTEWKETAEKLIELQKQWKEIGPVSRKKSDQIWTRFRAACDHFFNNKEKNHGGANPEQVANLQAKQQVIADMEEYALSADQEENRKAASDFVRRWNAIGFVPLREKGKLAAAFKEALAAKFPDFKARDERGPRRAEAGAPRNERDRLVQKYRKIEAEIATYENNIGFFASSKNADAFIAGIKAKIEEARKELLDIEQQIKDIDNQ